MDKTRILEKTSELLIGTPDFQDLAKKSVDLIVRELKEQGVAGAAVFRVNVQAQSVYAYAYSAKAWSVIDALLPKKFSEFHLPLSATQNLVVKAIVTGQRQESNKIADFGKIALADAISDAVQKVLRGKLAMVLPVRSRSGKVAGAVLFVLREARIQPDQLELLETFANQLGLAFSNVFAFERLMGAYKKKAESEGANISEENIPSIKFTLRISPRQYKKLNNLVDIKKKTKAEVIREIIDKAQ